MASSGDIRQILSPARFNTLNSDTQSVLLQAWNTHTGNLKSELEKVSYTSEAFAFLSFNPRDVVINYNDWL